MADDYYGDDGGEAGVGVGPKSPSSLGSPGKQRTPAKRQTPAKSESVRIKSKLRDENAALQLELAKSKEDAEKFRTKLHNAIRKGKAIEADRNDKIVELDKMKRKLEEAETQLEDAGSQGSVAKDAVTKDAYESIKEELSASKADAAAWKLKAEAASKGGSGGISADDRIIALEAEVDEVRKEKKGLEQKMAFEVAVKEGAIKEAEQKLENSTERIESLKHEMTVLQSAVRSAAERVANATAAESRASEEHESQKSQVIAMQRRVAELEGQLSLAGESEQDKQRLTNEILNLRTERDELESAKLLWENDRKVKEEQLLQLEESLRDVQEECVRLTQSTDQSKEEMRQELMTKDEEVVRIRDEARRRCEEASIKERSASDRETNAFEKMQQMAKSLQSFRKDEEERKKKFSRLQGQYTAQVREAHGKIEALEAELAEERSKPRNVPHSEDANTIAGAGEGVGGGAASAQEDGLSEAQLKAALVAATEPLKAAIEHGKSKCDAVESELRESRQQNMELSARLAQMEVSASNLVRIEETADGLREEAMLAKSREEDLSAQVHKLTVEKNALLLKHKEMVEHGDEASLSEIGMMREQLEESQRARLRLEDQTIKIQALQKENKDLRWQIAMTSNDESVQIAIPRGKGQAHGQAQAPTGLLATIVKHRKYILVGYLLFMHLLVYIALTRHSKPVVHHPLK